MVGGVQKGAADVSPSALEPSSSLVMKAATGIFHGVDGKNEDDVPAMAVLGKPQQMQFRKAKVGELSGPTRSLTSFHFK
jgi:hypothetical protein